MAKNFTYMDFCPKCSTSLKLWANTLEEVEIFTRVFKSLHEHKEPVNEAHQ